MKTPEKRVERRLSGFNPLYMLFAAVFLVQIALQQFFVRLSPYLFALNISGATENTLVRLRNCEHRHVGGDRYSGTNNRGHGAPQAGVRGVSVGVPPLVVGVLVLHHGFSESSFHPRSSHRSTGPLYGLNSPLGCFSSSHSPRLLYSRPHYAQGGAGFVEYVGTFLLTLVAAIMGVYYVYTRVEPTPSLYTITLSYNLAINLLGIGVAAYALAALVELKGKGRWLSLGLALAGGAGVAYVFYGGLFSDKILELTWQTSFGNTVTPASKCWLRLFYATLTLQCGSRLPYG